MPTSTSSTNPAVNRRRLLERFLQYVKIDTTANAAATTYPSSGGQLEIGKLLVDELRSLSLDDVHQDENGLVWATVPATDGGLSPAVAFIAHLDTSPESPGANVRPQVIEEYRGGDIELPNGQVISADAAPELAGLVGKTLITSDGTTLLGGDDKAGVAIMVELAAFLIEHPHLPHGPVRLLFTCDEEIGNGTRHIDLEKLGATVGYTIDGGGAGQLDTETFSADSVRVILKGRNIHPAIAKDRMINAVRAVGDFLARLPRDKQAPEVTEGREPFIHPYAMRGGVASAEVELLIRSFDTAEIQTLAGQIRQACLDTADAFPGLQAEVVVKRQYRNLRDGLRELPESMEFAKQAFQNLGRPCTESIIRGGTDGSQLTEMGLPTPNLSSGQHNIHSLHEFACLNEMVESLEHLVELLALWSHHGRS